jgi:hypothetical protein
MKNSIDAIMRVILLASFLLVAGCAETLPPNPTSMGVLPTAIGTATSTPFQPLAQVRADIPASTPADSNVVQNPAQTGVIVSTTPTTTARLTLWVDPLLPSALRSALNIPPEFAAVQDDGQSQGASLRLEVGDQNPVTHWIYALVAPFPTITQGVSLQELRQAWRGEKAGPFAGRPLLVDESTAAVFTHLWQAPASETVKVLSPDQLLSVAWKERPSWAIVPFEALEPRWKVLEVDGISPLRKDFEAASYPLTVPVSVVGDTSLAQAFRSLYGEGSDSPLLPASNRDPNRLTVLVMTGVTALVRATAFTMEQRGITYPGKDVRNWLRQADITHISNEVPFAQGCPFPNPVQEGMRFCSDPRYIGLLEDVGTDIVELTGDHFQDWGNEAMYFTLDIYRQHGWKYYGGGGNLEEARQAVTIEHNGNRLAFLGCNAKEGSFAQAAPKHPGAVKCSDANMPAEIARLREAGYLPIATFQHFEYYTYQAQPNQKRDFRKMAQAGAVIVSGSQAHQPQALEFENGALIHYGLGNLFFDQYDVSNATRQGFIDRHIFYDGRYIGTELLEIQFVDYARPRPMTPDERDDLLKSVFKASGW